MAEGAFDREGEIDPEGRGLALKISRLQESIQGIRTLVGELQTRRAHATSEGETISLDGQIERYRRTIEMNEQELGQLQADLLDHPRGSSADKRARPLPPVN